MKEKVYIAKLKNPLRSKHKCVFKVGHTSSSDAMDRINYRGSNELYPITDFFTDNKIMKSIWCEDHQEAYQVEQYLMEHIAGSVKEFHNWWEPVLPCGGTEMRLWNYDEVVKGIKFLEDWVAGRK